MTELESYQFRGQRPDEEVVLVTKQHIWLLMPIAIVILVVLLINGVVFWWFAASKITSVSILLTVVFGGIYSFLFWFSWNNSDYILTDQRVIKIDQLSMFNRVISEAEIHRIQEISTEIKGPIKTMFNFGTVKIKTASDNSRLDLDDVSNPYDVQQAIVQIQKKSSEPTRETIKLV